MPTTPGVAKVLSPPPGFETAAKPLPNADPPLRPPKPEELPVVAKGDLFSAPALAKLLRVGFAVAAALAKPAVVGLAAVARAPNGLLELFAVVAKGEAVEELNLPKPEDAKAEFEVCDCEVGDLGVELVRLAKGDVEEVLAKPEVGRIYGRLAYFAAA